MKVENALIQTIGTPSTGATPADSPGRTDPLPLNCPYCGQRMTVQVSDREPGPQWVCPMHGEFRIDVTGRLRDVPRA